MLNDGEHSFQLKTLGYTVFKSCIDVVRMQSELKEILQEYYCSVPLPWTGGGKWFGHINYVPSPSNQIIRDIASNQEIVQVLDQTLGPDYKIVGFGGNANLPGSRYQPAHADGWLGTDFIVVNVPLGEVTELNGSTEIWPETHREHLTFSQFSATDRPSLRLNSEPGDVVMRYSNLWHRGTPNKGSEVRIMLALLVSPVYGQLPPFTITPNEQEDVSTFEMSVNAQVAPVVKRGFAPNYFAASFKGNVFELMWMYAPGIFSVIRHFKKSSI